MNFVSKTNSIKFEEAVPDRIGVLEITRSSQLNSLNRAVLLEINEALDYVGLNKKNLRCLIVRGQGEKAFVAGADIKEMASLDKSIARDFANLGQSTFSRIEALPFPVIAMVQGFALGGGLELALSCDFIIAGEQAKFGLPEVGLGLIPGFGGTQRLARRIGWQKAKEMIFTGLVYSASEALQMGLVSKVVSQAELSAFTLEQAKTISSKGPRALRAAKEALHRGMNVSLEEGLEIEREFFSELFGSEETKEGLSAFIEKRKPTFPSMES